jgi:hypothetical protein
MKESILISILIIIIYIFFINNRTNLVYIENNGTSIMVRDIPDKEKSGKLLSELVVKLYQLRDHVVENINDHPEYTGYIKLMSTNF